MVKKNTREDTEFVLEGQSVPLTILRESRRNMRASVGRNGFILRMPYWLSPAEEKESLIWFHTWALRQASGKKDFARQFRRRSYQDGAELQVGERTYRIRIAREARRTHTARLTEREIHLKLGQDVKGPELNKQIRQLLSRTVAADFLPEIHARVHQLNRKHFGFAINRVRLKYNHSNWGSCSVRRNINLSTRLLFAPSDVVDYVIIHELAHLRELNHSAAFWKIVQGIVPDYRDREHWLRENRHRCDF